MPDTEAYLDALVILLAEDPDAVGALSEQYRAANKRNADTSEKPGENSTASDEPGQLVTDQGT